jgi:predicted metalloprotease with PDZ domain
MRAMIAVLAGAVAIAPGLGAQQKKTAPKEPLPSKVDGCVKNDDATECRFFSRASFDSVLAKRAVLGVSLSPTGTKRDTLGVFVSRVTPDGPAEKAGVVEGDRIVSINGIDLRVNAADAEDDYASGLPQRRLTR